MKMNIYSLKEKFSHISILFAEDDEFIGDYSVRMLEKIFTNVQWAKNGLDALELYKQSPFNIVITDLTMPEMNGIELIKELQKLNPLQHIIVTTAHANDPLYLRQLLELKITNFLPKPFGMELLLGTLEKVCNEINHHRSEDDYFKSIMDGIRDPVMIIRDDYEIIMMNAAATDMIDPTVIADMNHPKCYEVSHRRSTPCDGNEDPCPLEQVLKNHRAIKVTHIHSLHGQERIIELNATPAYGKDHSFLGIIESSSDITETVRLREDLKKNTQELQKHFYTDAITGTANKNLLDQELKSAIKKYKLDDSLKKPGLLLLNISHFKSINASHGHKFGEKVLKEVGSRLQSIVSPEQLLAHIGGDIFAIVFTEGFSNTIARNLIDNILRLFEKPFVINDLSLFLETKIGVSYYPENAKDHVQLYSNVDTALYHCSLNKNTKYCFYDPIMREHAYEQMMLDANMHEALQNDEFVVYFQPQVDLRSGKIIGSEALVRWQHPRLGLIYPDKFIPLAESTGMIVNIDRIVIKKALTLNVKWRNNGLNPGSISVNLTADNLLMDDFLDFFKSVLEETGCKAHWVYIEITEGTMVRDPEAASVKLHALKDLGVKIAIDDFGTGYSSLSYLKKFPIDKIKIDRTFVIDLPNDQSDIAILNSITSLANSFNIATIAEGVETVKQKEFLSSLGNFEIQGYLYSPPVDEQTMKRYLFEGVLREQKQNS